MKREPKRREPKRRGRRANWARMEELEKRLTMTAQVVINEIHYAPDVKTDELEFIELYNAGDSVANLSGWQLSRGVEYTFAAGTTLAAGQYLVVAQNPAALQTRFNVSSVGPFTGRLSNEGEELRLLDASGVEQDRVDYGAGFPWPTVGDERDASIQLVHPGLDNDLGGSWRSADVGSTSWQTLVAAEGTWRYWKGTAAPPANWQSTNFNDGSWSAAATPLGYGEAFVQTSLPDMQGGYTSLYLRQSFTVVDPTAIGELQLEVLYDDGINVWLNGQHVTSANVSSATLPHTATALSAIENGEYVPFSLTQSNLLVAGKNTLAIQLLNSSLSSSSDAFIDARLQGGPPRQTVVTPGKINSVWSAELGPQIRQVAHQPAEPTTATPVTVTAKVTDPQGVSRLTLYYQTVLPGDYFSYDDPRFQSQWTSIAMVDDGSNGDLVAGDSIYAAILPATTRVNRSIVRYRITAEDTDGAQVQVPYADDPQPNFAYYVYDGVPAWTGATRPGVTADVTYSPELLNSLPTYHLVTTRKSHEDASFIPNSTRTSGYTGSDYLWRGTLVYDGEVYDHINYRARGGVWRYSMGKNMWKFDLLRGHSFQARDEYGRKYDTKWDKINFSAIIQQGDYLHRGEQGLFESVGFDLFNLAGVESPESHYIHFRIVEDSTEGGPNQYSTDFQGMYLVIEQPDGRMLDEHELPDGNLYKMEGGTGSLNNQGPTQPSDGADLQAFQNAYRGTTQTEEWWRANLDLERYYSYRSIVEAIHHYDIADGKNYYFYHNPETNRWQVHPWDLDLTWANNMYGSGQEPFYNLVSRREPFAQEYRNRLREILDLLYNSEQTGWLIEDKMRLIYQAGQPSWVDADRAMWDFNPIMASSYVNSSKSGQGRFYQQSTSKSFPGMAQIMKNYVVSRTNYLNQAILTDRTAIPQRPVAQSLGAASFPINDLVFRSSGFVSPSGAGFAGMKWRIAEVSAPGIAGFDPSGPSQFEINAVWESPLITNEQAEVQVPSVNLEPGKTYRVRVKQLDSQGRWSNWSLPVQFVAGVPAGSLTDQLRFTEIHYHPENVTAAEAAAIPGVTDEDFEFIELTNVGSTPIDLQQLELTGGIELSFNTLNTNQLLPQSSIVLAADLSAFQLRFGAISNLAGVFSGRLNNAGETLRLVDGLGNVFSELTYDDQGNWPASADGDGDSLQLADLKLAASDPAAWQAVRPTPGQYFAVSGATVVGATPFYDGSAWDSPAAGLSGNSAAIATDKRALTVGEAASTANVITTSAGITGVMLDIQDLPAGAGLSLADFQFRVGTVADRASWTLAPLPQSLTPAHVERGGGKQGADRVTLLWPAQALRNVWLEITVLPTQYTGLAAASRWYLGSLVGDTGNDSSGPFVVDATDRQRIKEGVKSFLQPAAVDSLFDINRDRLIDGSDFAAARDNQGRSLPRIFFAN